MLYCLSLSNNRREKLNILRDILGEYKKSRDEYLFFCKFCNHHKPKLSVNLDKNVWKCWVCEKSGRNPSYLVSQFGKKEQKNSWLHLTNFVDFTDGFDIESIFHRDYFSEEKIELPKHFQSLCGKLSASDMAPFSYLKKRGITKHDIAYWKMGYCLEGEYRGRIVIPSFDQNANLNYFVARTFEDDFPFYRNPDSSKDIVFNELFLDKRQPLILVEGVFDAIVAGEQALPLMGSTLKEESRLFRYISNSCEEIYISLDKDVDRKQKRIISALLRYGKVVYEIPYPKSKDIGEITKKEFQLLKSQASKITSEIFFEKQIMGEIRL